MQRDYSEFNDLSCRLSRALKAAGGNERLLLSREVCDALSGFLGILRTIDLRGIGGPRFWRDDGVIQGSSIDDIEKAIFSDQLSQESDIWFFELEDEGRPLREAGLCLGST